MLVFLPSHLGNEWCPPPQIPTRKGMYLLPQKLLNLIVFEENNCFAFLVLTFQHWCYKNRSGLRSRPNLMLLMSLAGNPSIALFFIVR